MHIQSSPAPPRGFQPLLQLVWGFWFLVFQIRSVFDPAGTFWGQFRPIIASSITAFLQHQLILQRFPLNFGVLAWCCTQSDTWPWCTAFCVVCFLSLVFLHSLHQWCKLRLKRQRYPWGGARNGSSENSDGKKRKRKEQWPCERVWGEGKALDGVWSIIEVQISDKLRAKSSLPLTDRLFWGARSQKHAFFFFTVFITGYSCHRFHF